MHPLDKPALNTYNISCFVLELQLNILYFECACVAFDASMQSVTASKGLPHLKWSTRMALRHSSTTLPPCMVKPSTGKQRMMLGSLATQIPGRIRPAWSHSLRKPWSPLYCTYEFGYPTSRRWLLLAMHLKQRMRTNYRRPRAFEILVVIVNLSVHND
jgi:hypothetical protein